MLAQTRVKNALRALAGTLDGLTPGSFAWIRQVRIWLETVAPGVARPAREMLHVSVGVRLLLAQSVESVPASSAAARKLHATALSASFRGPQTFANAICDQVYALAVFHDEELACDLCQYRLELWNCDGEAVWLCPFGHGRNGDKSTVTPASRAMVIRAGRKDQLAMPT